MEAVNDVNDNDEFDQGQSLNFVFSDEEVEDIEEPDNNNEFDEEGQSLNFVFSDEEMIEDSQTSMKRQIGIIHF